MFGSCNRTTATATALWMLRETEREQRTKERVTADRQAALSWLFVEGIWQTKRAQWAGTLLVCCCGTKSACRQANCILLFVDGERGRQAVVELRERSYSYNLNAIYK